MTLKNKSGSQLLNGGVNLRNISDLKNNSPQNENSVIIY